MSSCSAASRRAACSWRRGNARVRWRPRGPSPTATAAATATATMTRHHHDPTLPGRTSSGVRGEGGIELSSSCSFSHALTSSAVLGVVLGSAGRRASSAAGRTGGVVAASGRAANPGLGRAAVPGVGRAAVAGLGLAGKGSGGDGAAVRGAAGNGPWLALAVRSGSWPPGTGSSLARIGSRETTMRSALGTRRKAARPAEDGKEPLRELTLPPAARGNDGVLLPTFGCSFASSWPGEAAQIAA